jgi:hypothetical protein
MIGKYLISNESIPRCAPLNIFLEWEKLPRILIHGRIEPVKFYDNALLLLEAEHIQTEFKKGELKKTSQSVRADS